MRPISLTRTTIGLMIIAGLLWCRPLVWFCGGMMLLAGLTGVCILDRFYRRLLGKSRPEAEADDDSFGGSCA